MCQIISLTPVIVQQYQLMQVEKFYFPINLYRIHRQIFRNIRLTEWCVGIRMIMDLSRPIPGQPITQGTLHLPGPDSPEHVEHHYGSTASVFSGHKCTE